VADYGFSPSSPRFNPAADLNGDGTINIVDVGLALNYYGATAFA
jgi:hypothetical protein